MLVTFRDCLLALLARLGRWQITIVKGFRPRYQAVALRLISGIGQASFAPRSSFNQINNLQLNILKMVNEADKRQTIINAR
jgi:hypothetical protein